MLQAISSGHAVLFTSPPPVEYPQIISILFLVRHSKPMQALPSILMSMTLYVTVKKLYDTLCNCKYDTLYCATFCMTLCITSSISLKIGCMTQKCMTQKYPPYIRIKHAWPHRCRIEWSTSGYEDSPGPI